MALSKTVFIGRLTKDIEYKLTPSGVPVANCSIAVTGDFKNKETGEYPTDFFNLTAWKNTADYMNKYLTKGRLVSVVSRPTIRSWVDQASGMKRSVIDFVVESIDPVGPNPHNDTPSAESTYAATGDPDFVAPEDGEEADPFATGD